MRWNKATLITWIAAAALLAVGPAFAAESDEPYQVEGAAPSVAVSADGTATITFKVSGDYHWNREYPAKVTIGKSPKVVSLDKKVFKQLAGDFEVEGEGDARIARVKVPFKGVAGGIEETEVETKFSICNEKLCLIKKAALMLSFVVTP